MSNIKPNTQKLYLSPVNYKETFIYLGRRYYLTFTHALISDYGDYGMLPPVGKGFYLILPKKDYKKAKEGYELQKINWYKALKGYLNNGGEKQQLSLF